MSTPAFVLKTTLNIAWVGSTSGSVTNIGSTLRTGFGSSSVMRPTALSASITPFETFERST